MEFHCTGGVAFDMHTRNENSKDSMGRWTLTSQPRVWQERCFPCINRSLKDKPGVVRIVDYSRDCTVVNGV